LSWKVTENEFCRVVGASETSTGYFDRLVDMEEHGLILANATGLPGCRGPADFKFNIRSDPLLVISVTSGHLFTVIQTIQCPVGKMHDHGQWHRDMRDGQEAIAS